MRVSQNLNTFSLSCQTSEKLMGQLKLLQANAADINHIIHNFTYSNNYINAALNNY